MTEGHRRPRRNTDPAERISFTNLGSDQALFRLKGTTSFGFIHSGGVLLGAESRITDVDVVNNVTYEMIRRDNKRKLRRIRGKFNGTVYCTMVGTVDTFTSLYHYLKRKRRKLTSIYGTLLRASKYLHKYKKLYEQEIMDYQNTYGENLFGGMIIGGYTEDEGHQLGVVSLDHLTVYWRLIDTAITLGSGAKFANELLGPTSSYGDNLVMTPQAALNLGTKILSYAATRDPCSGGKIRKVHIQEHNVVSDDTTSLDSFATHHMSDINDRSLFLLYEWPYPVWEEAEIVDTLSYVWPNNDVPLGMDNIVAWHFLANRSGINIHRLLFSNEIAAAEAYSRVYWQPHAVPPSNLEVDFVHSSLAIRTGTVGHPLYIARSSVVFLEHLSRMPVPRSMRYSVPAHMAGIFV